MLCVATILLRDLQCKHNMHSPTDTQMIQVRPKNPRFLRQKHFVNFSKISEKNVSDSDRL